MEIHKSLVELMGYGIMLGEHSAIPVQIDADDTTCELRIATVAGESQVTEHILRGPHENFLFTSELFGVPFSIDLKTNVMKKVRIRRPED